MLVHVHVHVYVCSVLQKCRYIVHVVLLGTLLSDLCGQEVVL